MKSNAVRVLVIGSFGARQLYSGTSEDAYYLDAEVDA